MLSLIDVVAGRPWAIRADIAEHVRALIRREGFRGLRHLAELKHTIHAFDDDAGRPRAARGNRAQAGGMVAVIPIVGTLTQRLEVIDSTFTRSTVDIVAEIREAIGDSKVDAIVLDVDSPGGEVYGVPEAWAAIREAAKAKPIVAVANAQAASAGAYLSSAATEFWVTPSGTVGSVGVYALHRDLSAMLEAEGESWTFIVADDSPFKVEGNFTGPLTDEARAQIQKDVNRYMGMFVRDLAKGRNVPRETVRRDFGQGRMLSPEEAMTAKMVDAIGTLDQAVGRAAQLGRERREGLASTARATAEASAVERESEASTSMAEEPEATAPAGPDPTTESDRARQAALGQLRVL